MKKLLITLSVTLLFNMSVNASSSTDILQEDFKVTLEWLEQKPKSYARDFFIIQYLEQSDLSIENARTAYEMPNEANTNVKKIYNKKFKTLPTEDLRCYNATIEQLKNEDSRCIALGLSVNEAAEISKSDLNFFINKLNAYPTLKKDLQIIASENPFTLLTNLDIDRFFRLFFDLKKEYRSKLFNKSLNQDYIDKISRDKNFERFIRHTVYENDLINIRTSLLNIKNLKELSFDNLFSLGINAVNHIKKDIA